jgi:hypothetical protein
MTVPRWALLAGITGVVANLLLLALFTVPGADWTGPANDIVGGVVSTAATIPVALAWRRDLPVFTFAAVAGMTVIVVLSVLLVAGVIPFEAQLVGIIVPVEAMFLWVWAVGRTGRLPRGQSRAAELIGLGAVLGFPLAALAWLFPQGSAAQVVVGGLGVLLVGPAWFAFPIWLIRLGASRARRPVPA